MDDVSKAELIDLIYDTPVDIAANLGFDKLTDLHNDWIRDMVFGEEDQTIQGHRGSFKTTCLSIAFAFIIILFPSERTMFMRKTDDDVAEVMNAVAGLLNQGWFKMLAMRFYGVELKVTRATQSAVSTNLKQGVSGAAQLIGLGCGASITGKHADNVFTDDIVNLKDRVSGAERTRIKLIYQELQNIKNRGGRIFNTGTPWHKDDAFTLMPDIVRYDCYSTGLMSREEIERQRASMSPSLFAANYELKHIADDDAMFTNPQFFHEPEMLRDGIAHIDASYGGGDGTAFTIMRKRDGIYYTCGRLWQRHVDDCLPEILSMCEALRIGTIYCESNADKRYLQKEIRKMGHPCATYAEGMNKYIKVSTYLRAQWGNIRFLDCDAYPLDSEYLNQILDYNENAQHDDAPDSAASLVRRFENKATIKTDREGC